MTGLHYNTLLAIAGSDSIGGAGIQADIKTPTSLGVYAMTAVTAVTAQNSLGLIAVEPVSPAILSLQLSSVLSDMFPDAVKIGMIPDVGSAVIIADMLEKFSCKNVVIDPVMKATSGGELAQSDVLPVLCNRLIPLASLLTPNIPETELLSGLKVHSPDDAAEAACVIITRYGCPAVLVKGGHSSSESVLTDVLVRTDGAGFQITRFTHSLIPTANTHGTGCTLSSAIASYLSKGQRLTDAVSNGIDYLQNVLAAGAAYSFGSTGGHGPLNHFYNTPEK